MNFDLIITAGTIICISSLILVIKFIDHDDDDDLNEHLI
mgnify:CR=1 FL=1